MPKLRIANISSMPLERRLPLLIGGLVTVVLACTLLGVRWELRGTSEEAAAERLEVVSDRIGTTLANAAQQRAARYREVASDPAVLAYALGRSSDASSVRAVLSSLRTAADGDLPVQLRNAAGRVIAAVGDSPGDERPVGAPLRSTDIVYGRFMPDERAFTYWVSIPVIDRGAIVGHVTLQRGSSASAAGEFIEGLLGSDMALHLVHADGGPWAGFDARLLSAMPAVDTVDAPFTFQAPDGQPYLAHAADVPGTPWRVVTHMPLASVTARTDAALRRIAVAGAFLLGLALLGAWLVGRGVARPIARLGSVADAIAAGDYSRRAHLGGEDEIGRLGGSFDAMAVRIERTHAELQRRFREAQGLAGELELANTRLHSAISDAEQARADAQAASSAKSEFLATMSHEIRTPINAIVGYADLLDLGTAGPLTPEQARFVERIRRSSEHLTSVVNDVLDFAKIESGQMRIEQQVGSARAVIDDAVAMFHAHAAARSIAISVRSPLEDVFLGDARRVQQILINLLSNAIKFTAAGGRVTVESERRESVGLVRPEGGAQGDARAAWTCIAVRDDGVGIEPDQLGAIFEPFVQGAGGYTRTHGGTGLGLAISRSLARMMDGDLTGESTPGEGSTFTLWLPHPAAVPAGSG